MSPSSTQQTLEQTALFNDILEVRALASWRRNPRRSYPTPTPSLLAGSAIERLSTSTLIPHCSVPSGHGRSTRPTNPLGPAANSRSPACLCPTGDPDVRLAIEFHSTKSHQIIEGMRKRFEFRLVVEDYATINVDVHECRHGWILGSRYLSRSIQIERMIC